MPKVLAIDYGIKRTGLALSDEMQIFAFGLKTVDTSQLLDTVKELIAKEKIATLVLGEPKRLNNESSSTTNMVHGFRKKLEESFPGIPVRMIDERFTSKMAQASLLESGAKKKDRQNKALLDTISATLILQAYLEMKGE
jgi:putative holliday junction resolvase